MRKILVVGFMFVFIFLSSIMAFAKKSEKYRLTIVSAQIAPRKPNGKKWDVWGTADPYVKVLVNGRLECETSYLKDTISPEWNHKCTIRFKKGDTLEIQIYDKDLRYDDFIGGIRDNKIAVGEFELEDFGSVRYFTIRIEKR